MYMFLANNSAILRCSLHVLPEKCFANVNPTSLRHRLNKCRFAILGLTHILTSMIYTSRQHCSANWFRIDLVGFSCSSLAGLELLSKTEVQGFLSRDVHDSPLKVE